MCLSIPVRIESIEGSEAVVSINGATYKAGIHLIDNLKIGDYVLLHAGFAIQKISDEEARETLEIIKQMNNVNRKL
ncbi:MAG TPA: HypC/HybG/HupF family hydrogenase formation chaperone [Salinivirga sp.]|uniref:HypC/HybG/HupF family hydrogenase formation chaperone n=1 Tax=Salinivirga sp. TaxID=1970192 RepID=UPI002B489DF2|nr:HypC/HybG/HupF family hydrogenase formation chaperone [Salinivirga sp.]HKK58795.1 HypC/HybG/HupF family hydrogenase formation chaperone [Salinivirga sp.]